VYRKKLGKIRLKRIFKSNINQNINFQTGVNTTFSRLFTKIPQDIVVEKILALVIG
jgi:hypothetical protein